MGDIIEINDDDSSDTRVVNYTDILKVLKPSSIKKDDVPSLIETMKPDLLQNDEIQCFTAARVLWDFMTASLFEGTQIHKYFELFLSKFEMGETDKIKYNISVILYILENDKEDVMLDLIGLKTTKPELIKALKTNYQNVPLEMCFKFVHFRLLPQIFSKFIDTKDKNEIIEFLMSLPMGFACEFMSAKEKAQLKEDIMKVYLPSIRPDNNISKWWNYCKVLIHYSGKLLHTEIELTNAILRRVECGFKAKVVESRSGSYECWKILIENYNLDPKYLRSSKQISLLIKPLKAKLSKNSIVSIKRFEAFICFIEYLENYSVPCLQEFLSFSFGPFDEDYKKPSDITNNQYFPGRLTQEIYQYTAEILLKLIGHDKQKCSCNSEITYLTDLYTIKPFLDANNINEHYQVFVNSVRICSLLIVEWTQGNNRNVLIHCLWDTLLSRIKNDSDASIMVLQNILTNIKSVIRTCLIYDSYYDILNGILNSVIKYIKAIDYKDKICKDFIYPLVYELCTLQIKKPNSIDCNVTPLFNYCKEGIDFYKNMKCLFIDKIPKCDLTVKLLMCTVMKISNSDLKADLETKDIIIELLIWFLDNDSQECYKLWKMTADGQIISIFPEMKYNLLKAIKHRTLKEKAMENSNIVQLLGAFLNLISKGDKHFLNDLIITIRYSLRSQTKKAINDHISILKSLTDIKVKHKFDNNRDFCILFVDLLKQEVYSVLSILKYYVQNLTAYERNELSKILHGIISSLTNNSDKKVSSDVSEILKLLDVAEPSIISRGAKIRNMVTTKVMPCGSPRSNLMQLFESTENIFGSMLNKSRTSSIFSTATSSPVSSRNKLNLNELSDADFVRIDADVFVDVNNMSEHQKEVASKRREDIPALYGDLTQSSNDIFESKSTSHGDHSSSKSNEIGEINFTNKNSIERMENSFDDKNDSNSSNDSLKRKRKRGLDDQLEVGEKSTDIDIENKNGSSENVDNVNEQSCNDSADAEPKNKKRKSDLKANDMAQIPKRKHLEPEEPNRSKPEVTAPISSRTKKMFDIPTNALKFKDKSPNTTSSITLMFKVPLNRSSLSTESPSTTTPGTNKISLDVSIDQNRTEEETSEEKEKLPNKNEKKVNRLSTNKKPKSLDFTDDEVEQIELKNNDGQEVGTPIQKECNKISIDDPIYSNSNQTSNDVNLDSHKDIIEEETSVSSHIEEIITIFGGNTDEQQKTVEEKQPHNQTLEVQEDMNIKSPEQSICSMPNDINLKNTEDIISVSSRNQVNDNNKGAEKVSAINQSNDNSKLEDHSNEPAEYTSNDIVETSPAEELSESNVDVTESPSEMKSEQDTQLGSKARKNSRWRRRASNVNRALNLLKMNIVGGDKFQNLPKKRTSQMKYYERTPPPRKLRSSETGTNKRKSDPIKDANETNDKKKTELNEQKATDKQLKLDEIIVSDAEKSKTKSVKDSTLDQDIFDVKKKRLNKQEKKPVSNEIEVDGANKSANTVGNKESKAIEDVKKKRVNKQEKKPISNENEVDAKNKSAHTVDNKKSTDVEDDIIKKKLEKIIGCALENIVYVDKQKEKIPDKNKIDAKIKSNKAPKSSESGIDIKKKSGNKFDKQCNVDIIKSNLDEQTIDIKKKRVSKQEKELVPDDNNMFANNKPTNRPSEGSLDVKNNSESDIDKQTDLHKNNESKSDKCVEQKSNSIETTADIKSKCANKDAKRKSTDTSEKDENVLESKLEENIIDGQKDPSKDLHGVKTRSKTGLKTSNYSDHFDIKETATVEPSKKRPMIKNDDSESSELSKSPIDLLENNNANQNLIPKPEVKSEDTSTSKTRKSTTITGKRSSPRTVLEDIPDKNKPVTDSSEPILEDMSTSKTRKSTTITGKRSSPRTVLDDIPDKNKPVTDSSEPILEDMSTSKTRKSTTITGKRSSPRTVLEDVPDKNKPVTDSNEPIFEDMSTSKTRKSTTITGKRSSPRTVLEDIPDKIKSITDMNEPILEDITTSNTRKSTTITGKRSSPRTVLEDVPDKNKPVTDSNEPMFEDMSTSKTQKFTAITGKRSSPRTILEDIPDKIKPITDMNEPILEDMSTSNTQKSTTITGKRSSPRTVLEDTPDKDKPITDSNEPISAIHVDNKNNSEISNHSGSRVSPNIFESSSDDDHLRYPSPLTGDIKNKNPISPGSKLHEVRVALFRNNFDELSPEKINKISHLNEISPLKDTETMEVVSQDSTDVKVSEMDTDTMNITSDLSEVSLDLVLEKTPERSASDDTLVSSPISYDTPTRNNELMNSTLDISPIKVDNDKKSSSSKISPDIFTSQKEEPTQEMDIKQESSDIIPPTKSEDILESKTSRAEAVIALLKGPSSRSEKLLNLIPQALPIKTHKIIMDSVPRAPQVSSPTTERIKRMMLNCEEQNQPELVPDIIDEDVLPYIGKDILKFEKEVPSPLATPKVSILKRKLPESAEEGISPCVKRKRVNFSDPPTTSEKIYFKEIEEKSHFKKMKKKSLKKLQYKIHHQTNNEQAVDKGSDELFDIKPLEVSVENDGGRVFHFVGQTDLEETEIIVPQCSAARDINILSNLIIKESPVKTKENKTTIKNYNKQMLKMAKNMFSLIKETTPEEEYTELISNFVMETLSMDKCIKVSAQLLKMVKDRTQEEEYTELVTGLVKDDMEIVPIDENQVVANLTER